jgi:hypothetical protein
MSEGLNPTTQVIREAVLRQQSDGQGEMVTLSTGVRARLVPVPTSLISSISDQVPDPVVPTIWLEDKSRDEPNPFDPLYVKAVEDSERQRGQLVMDAMIFHGVKLVDGVPDKSQWLPQLEFSIAQRWIPAEAISDYDLSNPMQLEFVFKKYVAVAAPDLRQVRRLSGMLMEDVDDAVDKFPSQA